jgi:hypothetical protein
MTTPDGCGEAIKSALTRVVRSLTLALPGCSPYGFLAFVC